MGEKLTDCYALLLDSIPSWDIEETSQGRCWTAVRNKRFTGICMSAGNMQSGKWENPEHYSLKELSQWILDWNFSRASYGLAAINSYYNRVDNPLLKNVQQDVPPLKEVVLDSLQKGNSVVSIGNFPFLRNMDSKNLIILEREPKTGNELPDTACETVVPGADMVLVTASSIINKSFVRLMELVDGIPWILVGPSSPLCEDFLNYCNPWMVYAQVVQDEKKALSLVRNGAGGELFHKDVFLPAAFYWREEF
jgi:uncharacterized protein (DUF4213/DUF364 family)